MEGLLVGYQWLSWGQADWKEALTEGTIDTTSVGGTPEVCQVGFIQYRRRFIHPDLFIPIYSS
jgi:hypothetical protein